jgi:hypothetical protein
MTPRHFPGTLQALFLKFQLHAGIRHHNLTTTGTIIISTTTTTTTTATINHSYNHNHNHNQRRSAVALPGLLLLLLVLQCPTILMPCLVELLLHCP